MSIFNNMELKNQEVRKTKFQKFDNRNSRDSNIESQDFRYSEGNFNNISNNELRNGYCRRIVNGSLVATNGNDMYSLIDRGRDIIQVVASYLYIRGE